MIIILINSEPDDVKVSPQMSSAGRCLAHGHLYLAKEDTDFSGVWCVTAAVFNSHKHKHEDSQKPKVGDIPVGGHVTITGGRGAGS